MFEESGLAGFRIARHLNRTRMFSATDLWPAPKHVPTVVRMLAVVFLWFGVCLVFLNLGSGNSLKLLVVE